MMTLSCRVGCLYLMLRINLIKEAAKPKKLAIGTHSLIGSLKKIIMNGVIIPPPPRPPALARIVMKEQTIMPQ